jgi:hypothetical protein
LLLASAKDNLFGVCWLTCKSNSFQNGFLEQTLVREEVHWGLEDDVVSNQGMGAGADRGCQGDSL